MRTAWITVRLHCCIALGLLLCGCSGHTVTPSTQPSFTLDASKPFTVELGRGSGWHGLDIVHFDSAGVVTVTRFERRDPPDTATLQLTAADLQALVDCINTQHIASMHARYAGQMIDGTQWVFFMEQDSAKKAIYFDNVFPPAIETFAKLLDSLVVSTNTRWTPVSPDIAKAQQQLLWSRIH